MGPVSHSIRTRPQPGAGAGVKKVQRILDFRLGVSNLEGFAAGPESPETMISLVLGLGNIGRKYAATRHNLGFEVVDRVKDAFKAEARPNTDQYAWAVAQIDRREVILGWPQTFVNLSGIAAKKLLFSTGISPAEMLVVVDDFNLPLGTLRFRAAGSDGGHNGLSSLIEVLGTKEFPRLRLGIGPIPPGADVVKFVLGQFDPGERERVDPMIGRATAAVLFAITHRFDETMSRYNVNPALLESA